MTWHDEGWVDRSTGKTGRTFAEVAMNRVEDKDWNFWVRMRMRLTLLWLLLRGWLV